MAKKRSTDKLRPTPQDLVADLQARGGSIHPWHDAVGAKRGSCLRGAVETGRVAITADGGLVLVPDITKTIEETAHEEAVEAEEKDDNGEDAQ